MSETTIQINITAEKLRDLMEALRVAEKEFYPGMKDEASIRIIRARSLLGFRNSKDQACHDYSGPPEGYVFR